MLKFTSNYYDTADYHNIRSFKLYYTIVHLLTPFSHHY